MSDLEFGCQTAEEYQRYFEHLCEMDEQEFRKLWENSEVCAKWKALAKRFAPDPVPDSFPEDVEEV